MKTIVKMCGGSCIPNINDRASLILTAKNRHRHICRREGLAIKQPSVV